MRILLHELRGSYRLVRYMEMRAYNKRAADSCLGPEGESSGAGGADADLERVSPGEKEKGDRMVYQAGTAAKKKWRIE